MAYPNHRRTSRRGGSRILSLTHWATQQQTLYQQQLNCRRCSCAVLRTRRVVLLRRYVSNNVKKTETLKTTKFVYSNNCALRAPKDSATPSLRGLRGGLFTPLQICLNSYQLKNEIPKYNFACRQLSEMLNKHEIKWERYTYNTSFSILA